jgi:undecaprenyl-diphosphatase
LDGYFARRSQRDSSVDDISLPKALRIGFFQVISMVPGVSRSAATIIGGLTQGLSPTTAAEFSFFLAVPTMFAATCKSLWDYVDEGGRFSNQELLLLAVGNVVAFVVAMLAIRSFVRFLTKNGFRVFGYYRIVAGVIILILWKLGYFDGVNVGDF